MDADAQTNSGVQQPERRKPVKSAIVQCETFRCLATLWTAGKRRDSRETELPVLYVISDVNPS